jgi:hypothetical protein
MNINKSIYEFVTKHPLCKTQDIAKHIGRTKEQTAKICYLLEERDSLRCPIKIGGRNRWIVGENNTFNEITKPRKKFYRGGNPYGGGGNGDMINRKRVATIAVSAQDALALLSAGASKLFVE